MLPNSVAITGWWCALSFLIVSISYISNKPSLLGKTHRGTFSPLLLLWLPAFFINWLFWRLSKLKSQEPTLQKVTPFLTIGRRVSADELPDEIDQIIDLTAEFNEPRRVRKKAFYYNFPILRGNVPSFEKLLSFIDSIEFKGRKSYVHCADGHGRTLLFCVIALVKKGYYDSIEEATALIQRARPTACMTPKQQAFANHLMQTHLHKSYQQNS